MRRYEFSLPKEGIAAHTKLTGHECLLSCDVALLHAVNGGIVLRQVSRFTMDIRNTESSAGGSQLLHHVAARRS